MTTKKPRLGPRLLEAARDPAFFDQVHVIFGGTGAVGGATVLQLIALYEQAARWTRTTGRNARVVVTGRGPRDIAQFEHLLWAVQRRDHGRAPERLDSGEVRTAGGVLLRLQPFAVDSTIEALAGFSRADLAGRNEALERLLRTTPDASIPVAGRLRAVRDAIRLAVGRPFTDFLEAYAKAPGLPAGQERFRSVTQAIPLVSLAAYAPHDLEAVASHIGLGGEPHAVDRLKSAYLEGIRDDFAHINDEMADEVLAAHTTGVGGMYDVVPGEAPTPRLDFAHRARDTALAQKQILADHLTALYAERGIKMLITAAAIGVDAVLEDTGIDVQIGIRRELQAALDAGHPVLPAADLAAGPIHVYPPLDVDLLGAPHEPAAFEGGAPLRFAHVIRSGENGFFTVSNADALYRVMRVTSTTELGLTLARVAAVGDDADCPTFVDSRSYYTETDNSRQVLDFLAHPDLRATPQRGLQPQALQDLGSSKHQGELHTLGLLVLLHRVRTLDGSTARDGDDAAAWFERASQAPVLADAAEWESVKLSRDLTALVTARGPGDLEALNPFFGEGDDTEFAAAVAWAVIGAVDGVPSLGTPLLYERDGRRRMLAGPYAAPVGLVVTHHDSVGDHIREGMQRASASDEDAAAEFYTANFGFADLRPTATLVTSHSVEDALGNGGVHVFRDAGAFCDALDELTPYSPFTTSGLLALCVRLRCLAALAEETRVDIGSANEFRSHFVRDDAGRALLLPGLVEAFRMVSEGWEKNTGVELLDGFWGYGQDRPSARERIGR